MVGNAIFFLVVHSDGIGGSMKRSAQFKKMAFPYSVPVGKGKSYDSSWAGTVTMLN